LSEANVTRGSDHSSTQYTYNAEGKLTQKVANLDYWEEESRVQEARTTVLKYNTHGYRTKVTKTSDYGTESLAYTWIQLDDNAPNCAKPDFSKEEIDTYLGQAEGFTGF
jgi:hypothetical protein